MIYLSTYTHRQKIDFNHYQFRVVIFFTSKTTLHFPFKAADYSESFHLLPIGSFQLVIQAPRLAMSVLHQTH